MLKSLKVRDIAIIDELDIEFCSGLNIITGETGAGKSIIINAVKLLSGERASAEQIRYGKEKGHIEAEFITEIKRPLGIERIIFASGKSRARINNSPASLKELCEAISPLLSICGQREHELLLNEDLQIDIIDYYGDLWPIRNGVMESYSRLNYLKTRLNQLNNLAKSANKQRELFLFEADTIDRAGLKVGEDEALIEEKERLLHAERLKQAALSAYISLYEREESAISLLASAKTSIEPLSSINKKFKDSLDRIKEIEYSLEDIAYSLRDYAEKIEYDKSKLNEIEERLDLIEGLKRRFGGSIEAVLSYREKIEKEIVSGNEYREEIKKLYGDISEVQRQLDERAGQLSIARKEAAMRFNKEVEKGLLSLNMKAQFDTEFIKTEVNKSGQDSAKFLFSANPGEPLRPLAITASGGELCRVLLVIKSVLSGKYGVETLIFDEVDVGIGGRTSEIIGKMLKGLSRTSQIICITHLPQIACFADRHFFVAKELKGGRTVTMVKMLQGGERVAEITRMLGGGKAAEEHAREMIGLRDL